MNPPDKIKIVTATIESHVSPTVISGRTNDGGTICARYRWGRLVIRLDHRDPPILGGAAGRWILDKQLDPDALEGYIRYEEIRELTSELIDWPDQLTPRTYEESDADDLSDLL